MANPEGARLIDLTRLWHRYGSGPLTGIDRVELAYLVEFLRRQEQAFGIVSKGFRHWILERDWLALFAESLDQSGYRRSPPVPPLDFVFTSGLARAVTRAGGRPIAYYNVGHVGVTPGKLRALRSVPDMRIVCMVHDTIPLDHPEFCGAGAQARFQAQFAAMVQHSDRLVCNSRETRNAVLRHLSGLPAAPEILVAHLGVKTVAPIATRMPSGALPPAPYFVTVGTVEPRKNLSLLLDVWEGLGLARPGLTLVVAGRKGWASGALLARLGDARNWPAPVLHEADLSDEALAALIVGARAVLMPSLVEGFGLPVAEAAAIGVPVVATDLPVYREVVGDYPIYLDSADRYAWHQTIMRLAEPGGAERGRRRPDLPDWDGHFNSVLGLPV